MKKLSHTDESGRAKMVNVGHKPDQFRRARAEGDILLQPETLHLIRENQIKKGDVLTLAQIAGIQAAKQTSNLIPLCHPLLLTGVKVDTEILSDRIRVTGEVTCNGATGVEMEALTAVHIALLTIYDMCKAVDQKMTMQQIHLVFKEKKDAS
ncbi:MAG: cyclic pyranopterin monophosphate synthase MoaC [Bacteroidales bacterium]|nr:cyclic pyranopterin monophosphate synthase MoaC [Bacteroidales bacterium]